MLKRLIVSGCFIALLFGRPCMAHQQNGKTNREQQKANSNPQPVPPTHVVVEPSPAIENLERKANDEKQAPKEKSVSPFARPEWVIVYITAVYAFISGWTLIAIYTQARWAKKQAKSMEDQLAEMRRQTIWLIEKERPRLDIELDLFDPRHRSTGEYCITGCISFYGLTIARDGKEEILVSTERDVVEDAFEYYREDVAIADFHKSPERIEIPRIIRPNSHDIPFSTTVYSRFGKAASFDEISTVLNRYKPRKRMEGSTIFPATGLRTSPIPKIMNNFALFCRVRIEYSAAQKTWIKEVRAKLWVFADHGTTPEYGRWEYCDEKEQCDEGCSS